MFQNHRSVLQVKTQVAVPSPTNGKARKMQVCVVNFWGYQVTKSQTSQDLWYWRLGGDELGPSAALQMLLLCTVVVRGQRRLIYMYLVDYGGVHRARRFIASFRYTLLISR